MIWTAPVAALAFLAVLSVPLGAVLGLLGFGVLVLDGQGSISLAASEVWSLFTTTTLSAIPLFILIGEILMQGGIAGRVYTVLMPLFRRVPGGLLQTNIAVSTIFGAISGSSMAVAAAVGSVAYPELERRQYPPPKIIATLAAGGSLGLLIPPSLSLLIFGALTDTSIGRLFMAGLVPGLLLALIFMVWTAVSAYTDKLMAHGGQEDVDSQPVGILRAIFTLIPIAALILAVLGSIVLGLATPTEAAGIGCVVATLISAAAGDLNLRALGRALLRATRTFAVVGFVIAGASILAQAVSVTGAPQRLVAEVAALGLSPTTVLLVVIGIYLVLGCVFEGLSMMVMTLPVVFPLMVGLGFDPVWLGVLVTLMIEVALITPPVGLNLFVLVAVSENRVGIGAAALAALPFWLLILGMVAVLAFYPGIALWLPDILYGAR